MTNVEALADLLKPVDARSMRSYPVSSRVNQAQNDDPECSAPVEIVEAQNRLF
jgi:putative SOS response-associated peptidase YedK